MLMAVPVPAFQAFWALKSVKNSLQLNIDISVARKCLFACFSSGNHVLQLEQNSGTRLNLPVQSFDA